MKLLRRLAFFTETINKDTKIASLAIIPALVGAIFVTVGFVLDSLITITPKTGLGTEKGLSVWRVKENSSVQSWQLYLGSPSPMPVEIAAASYITSVVMAMSSFFKLRPATKLLSAHALIISSCFSLAGLLSMVAGFNIHNRVETGAAFWLVIMGTIILIIGGILGHSGLQMEKSSETWSVDNLLFYFCALGSVVLFVTCTTFETFGDSSQYCTVLELGLCTPFDPMTKLGLFKICEGVQLHPETTCYKWSEFNVENTDDYQWALHLIVGLYILAAVCMALSVIVKFLNRDYRGFSTTLVVIGLGASVIAQCVISSMLAAYYHTYEKEFDELRYQVQYYGTAYYIGLSGLVLTTISLGAILNEESENQNILAEVKQIFSKSAGTLNDYANDFGSKTYVDKNTEEMSQM